MYAKRNTLDIDFNPKHNKDKHYLQHIIDKISLMKCYKGMVVFPSFSKGYHITLFCKKECDLCRFVYDDPERYRKDLRRNTYENNVLWSEKYVHRKRS